MKQQAGPSIPAISSIGMTVHKTTRRRRARRPVAALLSFVALAGLMAVVFVVPATGAGLPGERLPDLEADSVGEIGSTATYTDSSGTHLLLRFSSYIRNVGPGPLEVTGENPVSGAISGAGLNQVVTHDDLMKVAEPMPGAQLKYEETDGHNHWHFQQAARYSLWNDAKTQEIGFSKKVGFCFLDIGHGDPNYNPLLDDPNHFQYTGTVAPMVGTPPLPPFPSSTNNCLAGAPSFPIVGEVPQRTKIDMGISTGWRDVYERTLPFQYVDVSDVTPGVYWVRSDVDPQNLIREENENNAPAYARATVPGYVAKPVNAGQISGIASKPSTSTITLSSTAFLPARRNLDDDPIGAAQYQITEQPEHGTLTPVSGAPAKFLYTKDAGYNGPDTFKYAARQAGSAFPLSPTSASVTMQVGSGNGTTTVGISGAPAQAYTSAGIPLSAAVVPAGDVTWRVNDIGGRQRHRRHHRHSRLLPCAGQGPGRRQGPDHGHQRRRDVRRGGDHDRRPPGACSPSPTCRTRRSWIRRATATAKALSKPTIGRSRTAADRQVHAGQERQAERDRLPQGQAPGRLHGHGPEGPHPHLPLHAQEVQGEEAHRQPDGLRQAHRPRARPSGTRRTTVSLKVTASSTRIGPLCILTPIKT